jgi:MarR family transcriptional regulator for hemolysin
MAADAEPPHVRPGDARHCLEIGPMPVAFEHELPVLLHDVARQMRACADVEARDLGIGHAQLTILARLARQPDLTQSELAAIAEVAPITIARLIDRLEGRALVERCTDPNDRRIWRLRLTPAAAPMVRGIELLRAKVNAIVIEGIEPAMLDAMAVGLRRMKANMSVADRPKQPPKHAIGLQQGRGSSTWASFDSR